MMGSDLKKAETNKREKKSSAGSKVKTRYGLPRSSRFHPFSNILFDEAKRLGYGLRSIANYLGVHEDTVGSWHRNISSLPLSAAYALGELVNAPLDREIRKRQSNIERLAESGSTIDEISASLSLDPAYVRASLGSRDADYEWPLRYRNAIPICIRTYAEKRLAEEARVRGITAGQLAEDIVNLVAANNLFSAVIDDGGDK